MFTEIECIEGTEITKHRERRVKPFWRFFNKSLDGDKKAQCKLCGKDLSYASTTGNIKKHLREKHREEYEELPADNRKPVSYHYQPRSITKHVNRKLWNYFESINNNKKLAECKLCLQTLSYRVTIANLKTHLKHKHPETFEKYLLNSKLCPKDIGGESGKAPAVAPVVKFGAAAVVEPASPALVENQDEDSNSSMKFSAEIWEQFETEGDNCRCCICRDITDNTIEAMRNHLEESHPIVLIKILNKPTNTKSPAPIEECPTEADSPPPQSQNDNTESEMFTEVIYLDEALGTSSAQAVDNSPNEEIDSFLKYVGVLLKKMNKEKQSKMQLDILDIILRKRQE